MSACGECLNEKRGIEWTFGMGPNPGRNFQPPTLVCRLFGHRWHRVNIYRDGNAAEAECRRCGSFAHSYGPRLEEW